MEKKKYRSISKSLPIMLSVSFLILLLVLVVITYFREENRMIEEYRRMADGVTNLMIEAYDPEKTDHPNQVSIDWVGSTYIALEPFASLVNELIHSKEPIFETAFSEDDGYLLSFAKPILDKDGNYVASACVDFSMEEMHRQNIQFVVILGLILLFAGGGIVVLSERSHKDSR